LEPDEAEAYLLKYEQTDLLPLWNCDGSTANSK